MPSVVVTLFSTFSFLILLTYFLTTFFNSKKQTLEFIHIPKNAGTTIEHLGKQNDIAWGRFNLTLHSIDNTNRNCSFWHIPPKELKKESAYEKNPTFCVLREPFDRVVSAYVYLHRSNRSKLNAGALNEWLHINLPRISTSAEHDCHFLPQHEFMFRNDGSPTCEHILDFHNLDSEFNALMKKYDLDVDITTIPKANTAVAKSLTSKDLDDQSKSLIRSIYAKDFKLIKSRTRK